MNDTANYLRRDRRPRNRRSSRSRQHRVHPLASLRGVMNRARHPRGAGISGFRWATGGAGSCDKEPAREVGAIGEERVSDRFTSMSRSPLQAIVTIDEVASVPDGPAHLVTYIMWALPCAPPGVRENGLFMVSNN